MSARRRLFALHFNARATRDGACDGDRSHTLCGTNGSGDRCTSKVPPSPASARKLTSRGSYCPLARVARTIWRSFVSVRDATNETAKFNDQTKHFIAAYLGELSIAELTALLFIISLTLMPLTIWGRWYLEQRRLSGWFKPERRPRFR